MSSPANGERKVSTVSEVDVALDDLGAQLAAAMVELAKARARIQSYETYIRDNADVLGINKAPDLEDPAPDAHSNGRAADPLRPSSVDGVPGG